MSNQDPLSIGLGVDTSTEDSTPPSEAMAVLADQLMNRMTDRHSAEPRTATGAAGAMSDLRSAAPHEKHWNGVIPEGSIVSAVGLPFTDFEAANYKAVSMVQETGERFLVRALASDQFVVFPERSSGSRRDTTRVHSEDESDNEEPAYLSIPIGELKLQDFPANHPVHKCGLARYKRYMKKGFKFKPTYRAMLMLLSIIPIGVVGFLFPVFMLNLLPVDVLTNLVKTVGEEKLIQGVSVGLGILAVVAAGRALWDRHIQRYTLEPSFVKHEEGIIRRESTKTQYLNIQSYDMNQSILGRILNYGTIEISSSGSDGAEIRMQNVVAPRLIEVVLEGKIAEVSKRSRR